jgi:two-component system, OmpR family, phosphate regulon sensor histidine kinase PhoR
MRNSFFWRIFLYSLFLIGFIFSALLFFDIKPSDFLQSNFIFLLLCILIIISIFFSYLIFLRYFKPIITITQHLNDPAKLEILLYNSKCLPAEIKTFLISLKKNQNSNNEKFLKLYTEKKLFNSILATMNDGLIITDEEAKVISINPSAMRIFALNHEIVIGNTLAGALRNHKVNELWEKCTQTKKSEITHFETTPQKSYIQCMATPLDPEMPGNILFIFQDQTRIRQLEFVRRDFVSNVSHELRTPLTSLKLITETLQSIAIEDPIAAKSFIDRMDGEVDNLTQLVEELLELTRIESGRVPLEKQLVKPCDIINENCTRMLMQAERAGLVISYQCAEDLPKIFVDPLRIGRILINLIHNAIKFTPPGGQIEISAYLENNNIIFFVSDTGVGIPPKDIERIFERFYKADPSRSKQGTGLGLSISKHIIESHGGKIWAESTQTLGTKISFSIPLNISN